MSRDRKFSGSNPHNAISRELTRAKQAARMVLRKPRRKIKKLLQPAAFAPEHRLIKKKEP